MFRLECLLRYTSYGDLSLGILCFLLTWSTLLLFIKSLFFFWFLIIITCVVQYCFLKCHACFQGKTLIGCLQPLLEVFLAHRRVALFPKGKFYFIITLFMTVALSSPVHTIQLITGPLPLKLKSSTTVATCSQLASVRWRSNNTKGILNILKATMKKKVL